MLRTILAAAVITLAAAGAASAQEARVAWGDLDLATGRGASAFDARVDQASRQLCRDALRPGSRISDRSYCQAAARAEALRQLPAAAQTDYASARARIEA